MGRAPRPERDVVSERIVLAGPRLDIALLGRLRVRTTAGQELRLLGRHAQALFTLLALTRRPRTREAIAADLWPDSTAISTGPLRQALYQLRQALAAVGVDPDAILEADAESLGLSPLAVASLDVLAFERCSDDPHCGPDQAVALYGGDLAEGLGHDCFAAERERLADRYEDALAIVATRRLEAGDLIGARLAAEQLVVRDPLREEAHAVLIAVHGLTGTRAQVVRQYRRISEILARELDEIPLPETDATYRQALARAVERSHERAATIDPPAPAPLVVVGR
jgi:DNA-binding SARP family transcriptional activator